MQPAALWVTNNSEGKVFKVDPASGDILLEVEVGTGAAGVALGAGSAWVVVGPAAEVVRVNAETGDIEARIAVGKDPEGVAFSEGFAWVSAFTSGTVSQIDPATDAVVVTHDVGAGATGMTAGSVWVTTWTAETLSRIAADGTRQQVDLGGAGSSPAVGDGMVAATLFELGEVALFDSETLDPLATFDVGSNANVMTYGFGAFWVTNSTSGEIWRIDPVAGAAEAVTVIPGATGITAGADMIYVASFSFGRVYQFPPDNPSAMNDLVETGADAFELAYGNAG